MDELELSILYNALMEFRKLCGYSMPKKINPSQNVCLHEDREVPLCVFDCPLLKK